MKRDRKKILFVTPGFEEGGGERFMLNLFGNIDTRRFQVTLLSWCVRKSHLSDLIPQHVKHVDLDLHGRFRYKLPGLIRRMAHLIRSERPDLIVCMLNEWHAATFIARALSGLKPPLILEEQGGISSWLDFLRGKSPIRAALVRFLYKHVYLKYADSVICCSHDVADDFAANFGSDRRNLRPILNPLDVAAVKKMALDEVDHPWLHDGLPVVIGVGRLTPHKGNKYLVEAFARVTSKLPARLMIVADGPERHEIETLVERLQIAASVAILGYRSNPFKYVARSTLFVCPSVSEGCPYVVEEALAVGTPVVAARCTGSTELLQEGRCGLLVPQGDVEALSDAMLEVIRDAELRQRLSSLGRRRAEDFSVETIIPAYEEVFCEHI